MWVERGGGRGRRHVFRLAGIGSSVTVHSHDWLHATAQSVCVQCDSTKCMCAMTVQGVCVHCDSTLQCMCAM